MKKIEQPLILSLETSTRASSIAVLRHNAVLAEKKSNENFSQSSQLLFDISEVLRQAGAELRQIDLLASAVGPGSFTGLRIGLATAKALANALKIPVCGVSTLLAAAINANKTGENWILLAAGRSEYFVQSFIKDKDGVLNINSEIEIYNLENLLEKVGGKHFIHWISTPETIELVSGIKIDQKWSFQPLPENLAISVGKIASEVFLKGNLEMNPLDAVYARGADIGTGKNAISAI
jgi:tRNA threonylcarbamoyl adenosine modification protein YeaZ